MTEGRGTRVSPVEAAIAAHWVRAMIARQERLDAVAEGRAKVYVAMTTDQVAAVVKMQQSTIPTLARMSGMHQVGVGGSIIVDGVRFA